MPETGRELAATLWDRMVQQGTDPDEATRRVSESTGVDPLPRLQGLAPMAQDATAVAPGAIDPSQNQPGTMMSLIRGYQSRVADNKAGIERMAGTERTADGPQIRPAAPLASTPLGDIPNPLAGPIRRLKGSPLGKVATKAAHLTGLTGTEAGPMAAFAGDAPAGLAAAAGAAGRAVSGPGPTPRFFSRLERALEKFPDKAAHPSDLRTYLKKQGVKDAEIDWVLGDLRSMARDVPGHRGQTRQSVDVEDVRGRASERGIRVGETTFADKYTGDPAYLRAAESFKESEAPFYEALRKMEHAYPDADSQELGRALNAVYRGHGSVVGGSKYSKYTEPGGENYREVVLTLDDTVDPLRGVEFRERPETGRIEAVMPDGSSGGVYATQEAAEQALSTGRARDLPKGRDFYRSAHWEGVDNPVAHIRMSDRTGPDGEKILHIEEIQSDWAQQGRKKGFSPRDREGAARQALEEAGLTAEYNGVNWIIRNAEGEGAPNALAPSAGPVFAGDLGQAAGMALGRQDLFPTAGGLRGVPDMPFRETEDWLGLALRRVIDEAAAGGYDRIAWTPGAKQAKRYDLRNQVDYLIYKKNPDGTFKVSAQMPSGRPSMMLGESLSASDLEAHVGKDVARRMVEGAGEATNLGGPGTTSQPKDIWNRLEGDDLEVGGEGMIAFYDEMLPQQLKRYARSLGVEIDVAPVSLSTTDASTLARTGEWKVSGPSMTPDEVRAIGREHQSASGVLRAASEVADWMERGATFERAVNQLATVDARRLAERTGHTLSAGPGDIPSVPVPGKLKGKVQRKGQYLLTGAGLVGAGGAVAAHRRRERR